MVSHIFRGLIDGLLSVSLFVGWLLKADFAALGADKLSLLVEGTFFLSHWGLAAGTDERHRSVHQLSRNMEEIRQEKFHPANEGRHPGHDSISECGAKEDHQEICPQFGSNAQRPFVLTAEVEI